MNKTLFTQGPWSIVTDDELMTVSVDTGGESSCVLVGGEELTAAVFVDEAFGKDHILDANAALIAAAPDLYVALAKIVRDWDGEPEDMYEASAALAKVRGEK